MIFTGDGSTSINHNQTGGGGGKPRATSAYGGNNSRRNLHPGQVGN